MKIAFISRLSGIQYLCSSKFYSHYPQSNIVVAIDTLMCETMHRQLPGVAKANVALLKEMAEVTLPACLCDAPDEAYIYSLLLTIINSLVNPGIKFPGMPRPGVETSNMHVFDMP